MPLTGTIVNENTPEISLSKLGINRDSLSTTIII